MVQSPRRVYRPDIDGLRTMAVVPVVLFHSGLGIMSGGYVGVDVFFVISGFLITGILASEIESRNYSLLRFYERRARRILPALAVVLAVCFVTGWLVMLPDAFHSLSRSAIATLAFLSNFFFLRVSADYFGGAAELAPLLHTWSLAVEEQYYIFFPPLLWLLMRRGRRPAIVAVAVLVAASLLHAVLLVRTNQVLAFYLTSTRVWELGIGALLALGAVPRLENRLLREAVAAAGLLGIVVPVFLYDAATPFPGLAALPPCLGVAALIAAGGQGPSLGTRLLSLGPMVWIGLISYSLYLWHWPVIVFTRHYLGGAHLDLWAGLACVAASFVLGWVSWRFVERPFRAPGERGGFSRNQIFAGSIAAGAVLGAVAVAIWQTDGVPSRMSPPVREALAAAADRNPDRFRCTSPAGDFRTCRFGADAEGDTAASLLLWGDSHAEALMPGLKDLAIAQGRTGIFAGTPGCLPLLGLDLVHRIRNNDCSRFDTQVLDYLRAHPGIRQVVLVARWPFYAEGTRPPGEGGLSWLLARPDALNGPAAPELNWPLFEAAAGETMAVLRDMGREVIIVGSAPEIGWDVPERLAVHRMWGHALPALPDAATVAARQNRVETLFSGLATADAGITYLPLVPLFCDPDCRIMAEDGLILYADDDHINRSAAQRIVAPLLEPVIARGIAD